MAVRVIRIAKKYKWMLDFEIFYYLCAINTSKFCML